MAAFCKCRYYRCGWHGPVADVLKAPHPFEPGDELWFCPKCKDTTLTTGCDEPGCTDEGSCGWNEEDAAKTRRSTCYDHSIFKRKRP